MRPVAKTITGLLAIAAALGCSSSSAPAGEPATFSAIYPLLFPETTNARCNICHSLPATNTNNGSLVMGTDKVAAYAALVGKPSTGSRCAGKGLTLVVPGQPEASLFYQKLSEMPSCGSRMPLGGDLLSDTQREMVRSWIAAGAKND